MTMLSVELEGTKKALAAAKIAKLKHDLAVVEHGDGSPEEVAASEALAAADHAAGQALLAPPGFAEALEALMATHHVARIEATRMVER